MNNSTGFETGLLASHDESDRGRARPLHNSRRPVVSLNKSLFGLLAHAHGVPGAKEIE